MRIVLNCRSILLNTRTGIGRYTYHLFDSLNSIDRSNAYTLYARKGLFDRKRKVPAFKHQNFKTYVDYFHLGPPKGDLYHMPSPDTLDRFDGKVVVTVHDLIYKTLPKAHTPQTIDLTQKYMEEIVNRADKIICISEHTRADLHRFFDIPKHKTIAILNGVDHRIFYSMAIMPPQLDFLKTIGIEPGFILFVGTIEPRKNLQGVLEAMAQLKGAGKNIPKLVVVGMKGWMSEQIKPTITKLGIENKVIFTGYITDAQLNILYNACGVFVFPSLYEGFGFPIVEAFCAGAAVIASKTSCCPEIAGDAALLVDPADPADIAWALTHVMEDAGLRKKLKEKALERARIFSFEATARETLKVYQGLCAKS